MRKTNTALNFLAKKISPFFEFISFKRLIGETNDRILKILGSLPIENRGFVVSIDLKQNETIVGIFSRGLGSKPR